MSEKFNRPYPRIKVNKFIKEVAWIIESIKSLLTNQTQLITKETLKMSMSKNEYSSRNNLEINSFFYLCKMNTLGIMLCHSFNPHFLFLFY